MREEDFLIDEVISDKVASESSSREIGFELLEPGPVVIAEIDFLILDDLRDGVWEDLESKEEGLDICVTVSKTKVRWLGEDSGPKVGFFVLAMI